MRLHPAVTIAEHVCDCVLKSFKADKRSIAKLFVKDYYRQGIVEKCFDIWGILNVASVKSVESGTNLLAFITLFDVDLNFYCWDFRNSPCF